MSKLMTAKEVITTALDNNNISPSYFERHIEKCQEKYIRVEMGDDVYDSLMTAFDANTLNSKQKTLLDDHIKPTLAHFVVYDALPHINYQVGTEGVRENLDDWSRGVDKGKFSTVREQFMDDAKHYLNEMKEYLEDNFDDYTNKDSRGIERGVIIY